MYAWGSNSCGQLGIGDGFTDGGSLGYGQQSRGQLAPQQLAVPRRVLRITCRVLGVAAGGMHAAAWGVCASGMSVWTWGRGDRGQLGHGATLPHRLSGTLNAGAVQGTFADKKTLPGTHHTDGRIGYIHPFGIASIYTQSLPNRE